VRDGRCRRRDVSRAATRAEVAALRNDLPIFSAARDARSREPSRGDRGLVGVDTGSRLGVVIFACVSRAEPATARLGWRSVGGGHVACFWTHLARMAGTARRKVRERRLHRGASALRRISRRESGAGPVFVSLYPLMLDGSALTAVIIGG